MACPLTIFVLYSITRRRQFEQFHRLLARCDRFAECQKILIADNHTDIEPAGFQTKVLARAGKHFCWSDAWTAAMGMVESDKVLYLDCDRILPQWYLTHLIDTLTDYEFVYPLHLWNFKCDLPDEVFLDRALMFNKYHGTWWPERLTAEYIYLPCRGPLSGTSAFTAKTYHYVGPLDRSYVAWGYPDLEYQEAIKAKGCTFRPVDTEVFHLHHGYELPMDLFFAVNAWNGVRFFKKWKLPPTPLFMTWLGNMGLTIDYLLSVGIDDLMAKYSEQSAKVSP